MKPWFKKVTEVLLVILLHAELPKFILSDRSAPRIGLLLILFYGPFILALHPASE